MALSAAREKGPAFDETEHLAIGYDNWLNRDFRMETANGDFIKRWATLPLLFSRPKFPPTTDPMWRQGEAYVLGFEFLFQSGNDPAVLLGEGRTMVALLGVALGLLVFLCARSLFGPAGGLLALGLFVFSPEMLAHGALITSDLSLALALFASTWCVWKLLHEVTWGWLIISLVAVGVLLLSKMTAILIVPITAVMLLVRFIQGGPLKWKFGHERAIATRKGQAAIVAGLMAAHMIFGWAAVWANYDFRYLARANPADEGLGFYHANPNATPISPPISSALGWCYRWHFLPEGYLKGNEALLGEIRERQTFLNGQWKIGGWRMFFPYAFLVKTSPGLLLLLPLGFAGWWYRRRRQVAEKPAGQTSEAPSFYAATPLLALFVVYAVVAMRQNINIGHRHILPLYPVLYVLAGSAALWWPARAIWARASVILLILWHAFDSFSIRPHYLAYFNFIDGGPSRAYHHLIDSSLDWGMDLPGLQHWLAVNNPGGHAQVFFAYFGTGSPEYYGIQSKRLPGVFDWRPRETYPLTPGIYAISASLLESINPLTFGPWSPIYENAYQQELTNMQILEQAGGNASAHAALLEKYPQKYWDEQYGNLELLRAARLYAWLRHNRQPDDSIGYSILIFKLDAAALQAALQGPPAELQELAIDRR
ncbi:MAG TPA: glycosyltransferase family 39 protein [Opitutaceae bacterium]|nr:glycosyltransferase family 39 protein [Opitutaceae bacterium]